VGAHLSGSISRIASVLSAKVSVIAELSLVHELMDATETHIISGHPGDVAKIVGASVVVGAGGLVNGSAISIDLEVSVGVVGPGSESSADIVLASVSVTLIESTLAGEGTLHDGEAAVLGGSTVVASEFLTSSVHSKLGGGQVVDIHGSIAVVGGIVGIEGISGLSRGVVGGSGELAAKTVGESAHTVNDNSIASVGGLVASIDSASISIRASIVREALARAHILVALSSGGVTQVLSASEGIRSRLGTSVDGDGLALAVNKGDRSLVGNGVGIDGDALVGGSVAVLVLAKIS